MGLQGKPSHWTLKKQAELKLPTVSIFAKSGQSFHSCESVKVDT